MRYDYYYVLLYYFMIYKPEPSLLNILKIFNPRSIWINNSTYQIIFFLMTSLPNKNTYVIEKCSPGLYTQ